MLVIRPAETRDADALGALHVRSWQWAYAGLLPDDQLAALSVAERIERWRAILAGGGPAVTLVAEQDGSVTGFTSVGPDREDVGGPEMGELWALYVDPVVGGTGVGHRLHEAGLDWLCQQGFATAYLWVLRGNARARAFYERHGWQADGGEKVDSIAGFVVDEVRYRRSLLS